MNALPSYWIPTYVYAETWSSIITGCLSICHTRRNCLLSAAGTLRHLATIFMAVCLASWHPDWHPGKLLLRSVSIYTANKLNFSFMTPTTVCPVVGGWMPGQRRQTIVWQLSKVCQATGLCQPQPQPASPASAPATPLVALTFIYDWW